MKDSYKNILRDLRKNLVDLKENGPESTNIGICYNIKHGAYYYYLRDMWADWEHYSGVTSYPVPSTNKSKNAKRYYATTHNLWRSKQLELRLSLIDHLIMKIDQQLGGNHE